ncbi:hypothetical protein M3T53_08465 [Actinomyces sp. B33]|uniref:hypothetical protein n=1 Tax=Actinomyces sp. B33 TaxID=2942131 RepID=UPI002340838F|nr:hypothetical protein [Actinomyces sp. B33]MDC4233736.1 hypothetical protein [Actinomyces sp. B33]
MLTAFDDGDVGVLVEAAQAGGGGHAAGDAADDEVAMWCLVHGLDHKIPPGVFSIARRSHPLTASPLQNDGGHICADR